MGASLILSTPRVVGFCLHTLTSTFRTSQKVEDAEKRRESQKRMKVIQSGRRWCPGACSSSSSSSSGAGSDMKESYGIFARELKNKGRRD